MPLTDVAGNRALIASLAAELTRRPSHAYLFAGPRGVGKATVAGGLAQSILCERAQGPSFCCNPVQCPTRTAPQTTTSRRNSTSAAPRCACCNGCVQVALGVHHDFNSIARQPNRSEVLIEQVRDLIGRLGIRPSRGPRRVAIIDDAETLNLPAQNALLKTLEEPPGDTIIFMITQSERALLDTIRSRMRPVRFAPLTPSEIAAVLTVKAKADPARANTLALLARGSVAHGLALAEGDEPPVKELLKALGEAATLDFASIQPLVQNCFGAREQAIDNFELIARLFEEMLCFRLLKTEPAATDAAAQLITAMANRFDPKTMAELAEAALAAASAVTEMANSRLQAEQFFLMAGRALRG
ncbi:MAG TPA: DNA polymerase III subunit [Candidatus Binataceae bacterium]|nr:DNA polymerase III subunit [Candidatus Binataceae bacterium]